MTKNITAVAVAGMLALASTGVQGQGQILEQVLVKVNGEIITKTDLETRQIAALRQRNPNFRPESDEALQKALAEITPGVIVDAVDELLVRQRQEIQEVPRSVTQHEHDSND